MFQELRRQGKSFVEIKLDGRLHADEAIANRELARQLQHAMSNQELGHKSTYQIDDKKKPTFFESLETVLETVSNCTLNCPVSDCVSSGRSS